MDTPAARELADYVLQWATMNNGTAVVTGGVTFVSLIENARSEALSR